MDDLKATLETTGAIRVVTSLQAFGAPTCKTLELWGTADFLPQLRRKRVKTKAQDGKHRSSLFVVTPRTTKGKSGWSRDGWVTGRHKSLKESEHYQAQLTDTVAALLVNSLPADARQAATF